MKFYKLAIGIATAAFVFVGVGMASSATAQAAEQGDVIISEVLANPTADQDVGEYVVFENKSPDAVSSLDGWELKDDDTDSISFSTDDTFGDDGVLKVCSDSTTSTTGSVDCDVEDTLFSLNNTGSTTLTLSDNNDDIFKVSFSDPQENEDSPISFSESDNELSEDQSADPIVNTSSDDTYTDLEVAVEEASASSTIVVDDGKYVLSSMLEINVDDLTLKAADDAKKRPVIDASDFSEENNEKQGVVRVSADEVTVKGFEIRDDGDIGNGIIVTPGSNNTTIENNEIHGMGAILDNFGSRGVLVWGNNGWGEKTIDDFGSWGQACKSQGRAEPPTGTQIIGNEIHDVQTTGISLGDCTEDTAITNNTIEDLNPLPVSDSPIELTVGIQGQSAKDVSVSGNTITGASSANSNVGINLDKLSSGDIDGNTFNQTPLRVSHIVGASDITVDAGEHAKADFNDALNENIDEKTGYYSSIQAAIDETTASSTVTVAPGTYTLDSPIEITKDGITLEGAGDSHGATINFGENSNGIKIENQSDVTIKGLTFQNADSSQSDAYAIRANVTKTGNSGLRIEDNRFENITASRDAVGVSLDMQTKAGDHDGDEDDQVKVHNEFSDLVIKENVIDGVEADSSDDNDPGFAKGINLNVGYDGAEIIYNTIKNVNGHAGANAIDLSSDGNGNGPAEPTIKKNTIKNIKVDDESGHGAEYYTTNALYIHTYDAESENIVAQNKFFDGRLYYNGSDDVATLNATHNWWGNASGPSGLSENIDYDPYYIDAGLNNLSNEVGPSAGGGVAAPSRSGGGGGSDDNGNEQRVAGAQDENADGETDDSSESSEEESEDNEKEGMVKGVQVSVDGDMTNEQILSTLSQVLEQTLAIAEKIGMDTERLRSNY